MMMASNLLHVENIAHKKTIILEVIGKKIFSLEIDPKWVVIHVLRLNAIESARAASGLKFIPRIVVSVSKTVSSPPVVFVDVLFSNQRIIWEATW